jgi:HEPN domain-containing protein/predicted nucleotidyltransferase
MKTSLEHLPQHKQAQLRAITEALCSFAPVDLVILFGSYARGDWVEDLENGYFSDYDILVVVKDAKVAADDMLWARASQRLLSMTGRVPVTLLVHDLKHVNLEIRTGQYFFSDIVLEGVVLYRTGSTQLAKPKAMNTTERLRLGERSFRYWYHSATEFWHGSAYYAARGELPAAAFLLHQAAERYFHAVLLVYTNYKPKTHDIELLANQTAPLHASLVPVLPRTEPEDERLFKLLKRAYIEALG